jgi:hypothetical protein
MVRSGNVNQENQINPIKERWREMGDGTAKLVDAV